ncbi:MAG: DUF2391 family protein [Candidatus Electrothrix sp. ATG2]|nr:DUF2391 family protein [Candidatus Electrothrix sp. ATG2]
MGSTMEDKIEAKPSTIKRIGGYLHRVVPIADKSGKILSYAIKPFMVEFKLRDAFQVIVGASILAIPVALTEEAWTLGEILPIENVIALAFLSLLFISTFVYFNFYRFHFSGHAQNYFIRVGSTYVLSIFVVGLILTIIQKCPFGVDNILAIKRIVIVAFPASMSATVSDTIK